MDIVFIDTAGRSPRDEVKIRELAEFMAHARPDEVHLVLSAGAGERTLESAVERFTQVRADRLILTKLDEAEGMGAILGVLGQANRPVSYLTTGQAVPDDIEPADRNRLARLVLGLETICEDPSRAWCTSNDHRAIRQEGGVMSDQADNLRQLVRHDASGASSHGRAGTRACRYPSGRSVFPRRGGAAKAARARGGRRLSW